MAAASDLFNKHGSILDDSLHVKFEKYTVETWIRMNSNMFTFYEIHAKTNFRVIKSALKKPLRLGYDMS